MLEFTKQLLISSGLSASLAGSVAPVIGLLLIIILAFVVDLATRKYLFATLKAIALHTKTTWDDAILKRKTHLHVARIIPALLVYMLAPASLHDFGLTLQIIQGALIIYIVLTAALAISSFFNAVEDIYKTFPVSKEIPVRGFVQVLQIVVYFLAGIFIFSTVVGKTPLYLLSGLGALTAVLLIIFKDPLLGLMAGIQLTANRMVANGDWIEMPKYGADGGVLEVSLTTVKVQNFDNTITTIPTYSLISESFKNWRSMTDSGARRIKRSINIDMNTIRFCDEAMLHKFAQIKYITEYIEQKKHELAAFNEAEKIDNSSLVNGRRMTNVGVFRAYITAYLENHSRIAQEATFLIRQLKPTESGLPIEIYVFCKDTAWAVYEQVQADIFDHVLAVVPEFELRVFQNASGHDFRMLSARA